MLLIYNIKLEINNEVQKLKRNIESWQLTIPQNCGIQSYKEVMVWLTYSLGQLLVS
jgi:hypothetical protein